MRCVGHLLVERSGNRMSEELKACPFCGGEAALVGSATGWFVECKRGCIETVYWPGDRGGLIQRWNTRPTTEAEGLREAHKRVLWKIRHLVQEYTGSNAEWHLIQGRKIVECVEAALTTHHNTKGEAPTDMEDRPDFCPKCGYGDIWWSDEDGKTCLKCGYEHGVVAGFQPNPPQDSEEKT